MDTLELRFLRTAMRKCRNIFAPKICGDRRAALTWKVRSCFSVTASMLSIGAIVATPVLSQVEGLVVDDRHDPIDGVSVELWDGSERLGHRVTVSDGRFRFATPEAQASHELLLRRIGYRTARVTLPLAPPARIALEPQAIELEGVVVEGRSEPICPNREDPAARDLWQAVASRYSRASDTLEIEGSMITFRDELHASEVGRHPPEHATPRGTTRSTGELRRIWRQVVADRGYGYPVKHGSVRTGVGLWAYPSLQNGFAEHFVDSLFAELHTLQREDLDGGTATLTFCPRRRARSAPVISGLLVIANDTSLVEAEWRFTTPSPTEHAGGRVVFLPREHEDDKSFLLPATATFWRALPDDWFYRESRRFFAWRVGDRHYGPTNDGTAINAQPN